MVQVYFAGRRAWNRKKSFDRLLNLLMKYNVISFDIFDTTLMRVFADPKKHSFV